MSASRSRFGRSLLAAAIFTVSLATSSAIAYPGELDLTFGTNGVTTHNVQYKTYVRKVVNFSRKSLVLGYYDYPTILPTGAEKRLFVRLYSSTGDHEQTFGSSYRGEAYAAAIQPDGKIVVLGQAPNTIPNGVFGTISTTSPAVWRFNADGSIDSTFGTNGVRFIAQIATMSSLVNEIGIYDGRIYISYASKAASHDVFRYRIARLSAAGEIDFTIVPPFIFDSANKGFAMEISGRGDIYVVGQNQSAQNSVIRRYNRDGAVVMMGFFAEAIVPDCGNPEVAPKDLVIQPDGKLLVLRTSGIEGPLTLTRQTSSGSNDQTFQCTGYNNMPAAVGQAIFLQQDGKFFFNWGVTNGSLRFNPDGSFESAIGISPGISTVQDDQRFVTVRGVYPTYTSIEIERRFLD